MEPQSQAGVFLGWLSAQFVNDDDAQIGIKVLYAGKKINMSEKNYDSKSYFFPEDALK